MADVKLSVLAEIDATDLFEDENVNWRYCTEIECEDASGNPVYKNVTFAHSNSCEFIIHIGEGEEDISDLNDGGIFENTVKKMTDYGCTEAFIAAYKAAKEAGAVRVCFYA